MRLERALLWTIALHALAMLSMALLLLPGMPGGGVGDAERIGYLATNPWRFRLGWLPWQLTALSDLYLGYALLRSPLVPRVAALVAALFTVAAVVPDQLGQALWITRGLALARDGAASDYLSYERGIFSLTAAWGATLYTLGALAWIWCFVAAGTWHAALSALSALLIPLFLAVSLAPLFGAPPKLVAGGNALAFVLLELWLVGVAECVMRRARPDRPRGRWAPLRHPRVRALDVLANSRFARECARLLPSLALISDVSDVLYVNYLVPAERLEPLVPEGLELQRLGERGTHALFTFLSYRHGRFGPRALGLLRWAFPSPLQSNWRIHVREPSSGRLGVHFVATAIDNTLYTLLARLLVDGMPMHTLARAKLERRGAAHRLVLDAGRGSAPDATAELAPSGEPADGPWRVCFASFREFLAYAVPQNRVFSSEPWHASVTRLEIDLGDIPLESCEPLAGDVQSLAARAICGDAEAFAFRVPRARLLFKGEERDPLPSRAPG